jgi:iron complex outermembrane receptor protein
MKIFYAVILFLLSTFATFAQNNATIAGLVINNADKPLSAATITLLSAKDSSIYKTAVSDSYGKYLFEKVKAGAYLVKVSNINFATWYSSAFQVKEGETYALPAAQLLVADKKLKDVVVTTTKKPMIEVRADRTVFNVENSINATGSNALELLQKSPGVTVDKDENISMKGKNGVRIYIDGKPSPMAGTDLAAYLKSVQSSDIESIEMIENPSAKFDASGNAGIINIRFKKNKKFGTNGSTSLGYNQGIYSTYNGNVSLNYRNKKINVFSNISANKGISENWNNFYRLQSDSIYDQKATNKSINKGGNIKAGADYFINDKNTIGFMVNSNFNNREMTSDGQTFISAQSTKLPTQILKAGNRIPSDRSNSNINLNYRYSDTSGRELNIDADRGIFRHRGNSMQPNYYVDANTGAILRERIFANNTPINIDIYTGKIDYEQKFAKGKLGAGAKYSSVKTANTFDFYNVINSNKQIDFERSNNFTYTEAVSAGYINYNRSFKKWSMQLGVRAEQTNSEGVLHAKSKLTMKDTTEIVKREYLNFFPSAAFSYTLSANHQFNINYSRRIDRPRYQDLNPFENKLDELTYEKGNAFLRPQYTNSFSLSHTYKSFLTTSLSYSHISDYITEINDTARTNATFITDKNLASQDVYSINISAPFKIIKWWNVFANLTANQSKFKANFDDGKTINLTVSTLSYYNQHTFTLGKGFTGEVSGWLNTPSIWGGTFKTNFMWSADAGIQKSLMNNKATLKLSVIDVFKSNRWKARSDFAGIIFNVQGGYDSRQARLSFQYRFGSNQVKAARARKTSLESEASRL